jgi:hypothetical protein
MQVVQNLALQQPMKVLSIPFSQFSSHGYLKIFLSFSLPHETLKQILIWTHESRKWGNNPNVARHIVPTV